MQTVTTLGFDIAKSVFQVHGVDSAGQVVIRRQLKRRQVLAFFQKLPFQLRHHGEVLDDVHRHARPQSSLQPESGTSR